MGLGYFKVFTLPLLLFLAENLPHGCTLKFFLLYFNPPATAANDAERNIFGKYLENINLNFGFNKK